MIITEDILNQIGPIRNTDELVGSLNSFLPGYHIDTPNRVAAFLSQTCYESGNFSILSENLNYSASRLVEVFPHYFPNLTIANKYQHQPKLIADRIYSNRMGNGDEASGDGYKYCGRGLIQLTGKSMYVDFANSINMSLSDVTNYLTTISGAVQSACWFWFKNGLNGFADNAKITEITKRINGGINGLEDRIDLYNKILDIITK